MEHPLIANLNDLTEEQLLEKVTELQRKLSIAGRRGLLQAPESPPQPPERRDAGGPERQRLDPRLAYPE